MKKCLLFTGLFFLMSYFSAFAQSGQVSIQEPEGIAELVKLKTEMSAKSLFGHRFNIQLGAFSTLSQARKVQDEFKKNYPNRAARIQYESPSYKVWVGNFASHLAAERLFLKLKNKYKSAIVFRLNP